MCATRSADYEDKAVQISLDANDGRFAKSLFCRFADGCANRSQNELALAFIDPND